VPLGPNDQFQYIRFPSGQSNTIPGKTGAAFAQLDIAAGDFLLVNGITQTDFSP